MRELAHLLIEPLVYAALVTLVFVPLEALAPLRAQRRCRYRADVLFATVGAIFAQLGVYLTAGALLALSGHLGSTARLADAPSWLALPLSLVVFELGGYAYHRAAHRFAWLSRLHAVHHSATHMDWLAGFRQHPLEIGLMTAAQNLPLVLLGLPVEAHALLILLVRLNSLFVHSNVRTPAWLRHVLATPTFHHRHHGVDGPAANFATLLPVLDRVFGTHAEDQASRFGLGSDEEPSFLALLLLRSTEAPERPRNGASPFSPSRSRPRPRRSSPPRHPE
ncbi:MAG: sterol desaturase family protein [Sandaracinaceae bacterium]